jgi:hypothetical protein
MSGELHGPAALPLGKNPRCPLNRRLGGGFFQTGKISCLCGDSKSGRSRPLEERSRKLVVAVTTLACFGNVLFGGGGVVLVPLTQTVLHLKLRPVPDSLQFIWLSVDIPLNAASSATVTL